MIDSKKKVQQGDKKLRIGTFNVFLCGFIDQGIRKTSREAHGPN